MFATMDTVLVDSCCKMNPVYWDNGSFTGLGELSHGVRWKLAVSGGERLDPLGSGKDEEEACAWWELCASTGSCLECWRTQGCASNVGETGPALVAVLLVSESRLRSLPGSGQG